MNFAFPVGMAAPDQSLMNDVMNEMKSAPRSYEAGTDLEHDGDRPKNIYVIQSGWAYSYVLLAGGQRQILYLYQPGDIAGLSNVGLERINCSLRSLSDCAVSAVSMASLMDLSVMTVDAAIFLLKKSAEMQSYLMRTLVAAGRMSARERTIWLILMFQDRLHQSQTSKYVVDIPFNQTDLGDLIGLTNVSISKVLCELSNEGYIERKGGQIELRRRSDLEAMINYQKIRPARNSLTIKKRIGKLAIS